MDKLLDFLDWDIEIRRAHMIKRERPRVAVTEIEEGRILEAGGVTVSAFSVDHDPVKPAFGYRFEGGGRRVVVSGDTRPSENLIRWSQGVDCLIHECCEMAKTSWVPGCGWPTIEEKIKDLASYHTQPEDIGRVATAANPGKLVITHMMPGSVPADLESAAKRHYAGPVTIGEDLLSV
jgi:ribonuclease Z